MSRIEKKQSSREIRVSVSQNVEMSSLPSFTINQVFSALVQIMQLKENLTFDSMGKMRNAIKGRIAQFMNPQTTFEFYQAFSLANDSFDDGNVCRFLPSWRKNFNFLQVTEEA